MLFYIHIYTTYISFLLMNSRSVLALALTMLAFVSALVMTSPVNAQVLERDPINATVGATIQMTIDPLEPLPPNGTVTMSMQGMNDVDFKDYAPAGVTVIIGNESSTVTNQPVQIPGVAPGSGNTVPTPASTPGFTAEPSTGPETTLPELSSELEEEEE
jgi:hypothetical protein